MLMLTFVVGYMHKNTASFMNIVTKEIVLPLFCGQRILLIVLKAYTNAKGSQGYLLKPHYGITRACMLLSVLSIQKNSLFVINSTFVLSLKGTSFLMCSVMTDRM